MEKLILGERPLPGIGDVEVSARSEPDMATMTRLAAVLRDVPKPILVHARGGADGRGPAPSVCRLVEGGRDFDAAAGLLSQAHGDIPWFGSRCGSMERSVPRFDTALYAKPEDDVVLARNESEGAT